MKNFSLILATLLILFTGGSLLFKQITICPQMRKELVQFRNAGDFYGYMDLKEGAYEAMCMDITEFIVPAIAIGWFLSIQKKAKKNQ